MEGIKEGKTRSGLYYEGLRILEAKKPKYSVIENVKNLTSKRFKSQFSLILNDLTKLGYTNYWKVLNAKDYGIPQNRERLFIISIRTDIDKNNFNFPPKMPLKLKLKDILEENVEEKYYLSDKAIGKLIRHNNKLIKQMKNPNVSSCLTAGYYKMGARDNQFIADKTPYVLVNEGTKKGYVIATGGDSINVAYSNNITKRGRVGKEIANTILTSPNMSVIENISEDSEYFIRIRKLTPLECWRLMGFEDTDFCKAKSVGISDTQLYKQAGNSIVVKVLEYIFELLFDRSII